MNIRWLLHRNIRYFARYYRLVAMAVVITVAVIVGSLVVGDSVRMTLVRRVTERLGNTETIIFSRSSFISDSILSVSLLGESARGVLLTDGFISRNGKLVPVFVWGVDDLSLSEGSAKINPALSEELGLEASEDIVLRLPATGLVPSGSLFVTKNYTVGLRLSYGGLVPVDSGGNINLKNEQVLPFNVFVRRSDLAEALNVEGKINLVLTDRQISSTDLGDIWNQELSGLVVRRKADFTEITSGRVFLQEKVVETICQDNLASDRLFSYLVNSIEREGNSIPYSFITAMDRYKGHILRKDEILLSDYAANRLGARVGDTIRVSYYKSEGLKRLDTDARQFKVGRVVPLSEWVSDGSLSADFPGLSNVERCTDWDSDLPIQMDLITDEDERYWDLFRSTPKAIIAYDAVVGDWGNAYGSATAIRIPNARPDLTGLRPEMFGIQLIHPREAGIYAARNGVDFAGLFLALGFFIIVSAVLLMLNPLSEMFYRRRHEIALLRSMGYTRKRIKGMLWMESVPVVGGASVVGVVMGLLYTRLIMWLLGGVWQGATQTDGFGVYPGTWTLIAGTLVSVGLSLGLLRWAIIRALREESHKVYSSGSSLRKKRLGMIVSGMMTVAMIGVNVWVLHSVPLFMVIGAAWIVTAALWGDYRVAKNGSVHPSLFNRSQLIWATIYANRKQSLLSFFALSIGVFIVFSVGLNRKGFADSSQIRIGTGGYSLWCESSVPVYYDLSTSSGKAKLSLSDLPEDTEVLQCLRYNADDASCLNLNKVTTPTVLGINMKALSNSDFQIEQTIYGEDREVVFERVRERTNSVYPALVDATVLTWGIGMNLGDTLYYKNDQGLPIAIRLVGTLSNSVFQGNILVDQALFSEIWTETTGSEVFLLKTGESEREEVKKLISQALSEYGVRVMTTNDRLRQFNTVTDTYLTIFMTLGGLGLLLGILSFIIVIRKNLAMRRDEIRLYRVLGFTDGQIGRIFYKENILVPLYAILTGVIGALISVSANFSNAGTGAWSLALGFMLFFTGCVMIFVRGLVKREIGSSKL